MFISRIILYSSILMIPPLLISRWLVRPGSTFRPSLIELVGCRIFWYLSSCIRLLSRFLSVAIWIGLLILINLRLQMYSEAFSLMSISLLLALILARWILSLLILVCMLFSSKSLLNLKLRFLRLEVINNLNLLYIFLLLNLCVFLPVWMNILTWWSRKRLFSLIHFYITATFLIFRR